MFFESRNTRCYFWRKTGKTEKTGGKRKKPEEKSFTKIEPTYTSLLQINQVLAFKPGAHDAILVGR